jgi:hypothetical protein
MAPRRPEKPGSGLYSCCFSKNEGRMGSCRDLCGLNLPARYIMGIGGQVLQSNIRCNARLDPKR